MFKKLNLSEPLLSVLDKMGYSEPTPIQQKAIPLIFQGKDIFGCAQTGTGKTAAYILPMLQKMDNAPKTSKTYVKALILAPTRELALQIDQNISEYGANLSIKHTTIFGGVSQVNQVKKLRAGTDIIVATPGRLIDLLQQGVLRLNDVEYFVLDEADRMLDMGFIGDIKKIISRLPEKKQTMLFSATAPREIMSLANSLMQNPVNINADISPAPPLLVQQSVYLVPKDKKRVLLKHVLSQTGKEQTLIFTRTKRGADRVTRDLVRSGIRAEAIHGDKSQNSRENALKCFKNKSVTVLVATDIASRGIDIIQLPHVINFELPEQAETYIHRIGRTGRAGVPGTAISFCCGDEKPYLQDIQKLIRKNIRVETHPFVA